MIRLRGGGFVHEDAIEEIALPLYQGVMMHQFDFAAARYSSGAGNRAIFEPLDWEHKRIDPQFLMSTDNHEGKGRARVVFREISNATNQRAMLAAVIPNRPCSNGLPILESLFSPLMLEAVLNSFAYDFVVRCAMGGTHLNYFVIEGTPLIPPRTPALDLLAIIAARLNCGDAVFAPEWLRLRADAERNGRELGGWKQLWAVTPHERLRLRCLLDAVVAELYGLDWDDLA